MKHCTQFFESNELLSITDEQYKIYLTPEGELYNKSILVELVFSINDFLIIDIH